MKQEPVIGFMLGMIVAVAAIIVGTIAAQPCTSAPTSIERNQWGQEELTERELCKATILQWDEERCADSGF